MAINSTAFTKTPQAKDDTYSWGEDELLSSSAINGSVVTLDVMANDLGGNAKWLYSVDNGNGNTRAVDYDLLAADVTSATGVSAWEETAAGNKVRINNGKIEWDVTHSLSVLGAANVNALGAGEAIHDEFVYAIRMANGTLSQARVTVDLRGSNDGPVIAGGMQTGAVQEDIIQTVSGQFTATDADHNATQSWSVQGSATGAYGSIAVDQTGQWTYTLDNAAHQDLAQGESHDETFTIRVTDDQGAYSEQTVTVTVTGTNDRPVVTNSNDDAAGSVKEDATLVASGQLSATDVDHGATQSWSVVGSATGAYGSIAVAQTGKWTYTLANGSSAVQSLAEGESHDETFAIRVTDDQGAFADQAVTVTVTGTNDAPVITAEDTTGAVTAVAGGSGNIGFTVQQYLGYQSNNLDNLRSYAATHPASYAVQTNVIDYTDDPGGFAGELPGSYRWPAAEALNVNGTNASVNNNFFARITADFSVTTADIYTFRTYNDDGVFLLIDNQLIISDTGYHPEAPFNGSIALSPGNHSIELFFYEGGGEASLEFSARNSTGSFGLVGANGGGLSGALLTDSGTISFNDVDLTDVHLVSATGTPVGSALGTLTAVKNSDTTGTGTGGQLTWTYSVANSAVAYLAAGETKVESFTITLNDQHGGLITKQIDVTITGTNDVPVVAAADVTGAVMEMSTPVGNLTDSGTIAFSDVDQSDAHSVGPVTASAGAVGTLTASVTTDTTGSGTGGVVTWNYSVAASSVETLAAGQTKFENFTFNVLDNHGGSVSRTVNVTITGTNDGPVAVADSNAADPVSEQGVNPGNTAFAGDPSASGNVLANDTDVDQGDSKTVVGVQAGVAGGPLASGVGATIVGTYGSVVIGANGAYTYTLNNADPDTNGLTQGQAASDVFTYTMRDAAGATSTATLTIGITGTNDAPVAVNDTNALTVTSLASQVHSNVVNWVDWTSASPGQVLGTINLGNGQTIGVTYTGEYVSSVTQTNGGTNYYNLKNGTVPAGTYTSAAVANGPNGSSDIIALSQQSQKTLTFTQPVDNLFFAVVSLNGMAGGVNNGYLFDHDFQIVSSGPGYFGTGAATKVSLPDGRFELLSTYDATPQLREFHGVVQIEGTAQSLTWTSLAAEYWNGFTIGTYGKPLTATATGNVLTNDSDPESNPIAVTAVNGNAIVGNSITMNLVSGAEITVNKNGTYLYDEGGAFGWLGQGQMTVDSFNYTVTDSHGASSTANVAITLTGINDAPVAKNDSATTNEDTAISIAVLDNDTDPDAGDSKTLVSFTGAQHGTLAQAGGNVVYTPSANYNGADSFTYTMQDGAGAQSTATVNVTVNQVTDTYVLANMISNGSFEVLEGGAIKDWAITGGGVDRLGPYPTSGWQPGDGSYVLDLNALSPGGVQQHLTTVPGVQYTVGFDLSKNPGNTDHATVQASVNNTSNTAQSYTYGDGTPATANTAADMKWSQQTFTFVATGTDTLLSFASTYPSGFTFPFNAQGPALDEVVMVTNKVINNFTKGTGGDVLQLHDLLTSINAPHDSTAFSGGYLRFLQSGSDTQLQIDANGGGDHYLTLATLTNQLLSQVDTQNYVL